jgi:hypothetical protein
MLDRDRYYAIVYGDPVSKFYQDKQFYRGDGSPVSTGKAGKPKPRTPEIAVEQKKAPKQKKAPENADQLATLTGMHISKLKKLAVKVAEATKTDTPELKGTGLKKRLIAYIAENTD